MARASKGKVLAGGKRRRTRALRVEALEERVVLSSVVPLAEFTYGLPSDVHHFMGDWDGDGIDTPGIYRDGVFHLRNSNTTGPGELIFAYGLPGDLPIAGDWDGDGIDTPGVVRAGVWHLRNSNTTGFGEVIFAYGLPGDLPFVGDWNGDGVDTPGVVRSIDWHLRNSNDGGVADVTFAFGIGVAVGSNPIIVAGDVPVTADWDGDGIDSVGFFSAGTWNVRTNNGSEARFSHGFGGDRPLVGMVGGGAGADVGVVNNASVWSFKADPVFARLQLSSVKSA